MFLGVLPLLIPTWEPGGPSPWDWKKMEIIILGAQIFESNFYSYTKSNPHLIGTGYQDFREHWYDMGLEETEASEFSCICISPLASLLSLA